MLSISRKPGEGVSFVHEGVVCTVWVRTTRKGRVVLALDAPVEVRISRKDLEKTHEACSAQHPAR